jgi:hypothetical protein
MANAQTTHQQQHHVGMTLVSLSFINIFLLYIILLGEKLGEGGFGRVDVATGTSGVLVARKTLKKQQNWKDEMDAYNHAQNPLASKYIIHVLVSFQILNFLFTK